MALLSLYWWLLSVWLIYCAWDNSRLFLKPAPADPRRKKWPKVSILIPARNEEKRIGRCLKTVLKQDYPSYEVLVLDDRSTDGTFPLISRYAKSDKRLKVLKGRELTEGWLGKPWACYELSKKAKGQWLFFIDADTWHHPGALKRTVQMAETRKADVLTLFTKQVTHSWMEALVIPVMAYTLLAFIPSRWGLRPKSFFNRFAGVSGQFVFIRRKVYEAFGGHRTVKNEIVEDLNFGKQVVQRGYRLVYGDGSDISFCRMYTNATEVWHGFSKNFFPAVRFSIFYFLNAQIVLLLDGVAPLVALFWGPQGPLFGPALTLFLVSVGVRGLQAVKYGFHKGSVLFHPLGCLLFSLIGFNSMRWFWFGGGHWKGRSLKAMA